MDEILKNLPGLAKDKYKENKKFFFNLRQKTPKDLDVVMKELHDKEFAKTDCLSCANCCKTTGPLMTDKDITRISSHFRMKDQKFIETYLRVDDDGDFVVNSLPCPFLGGDNYCSIYDVRPKACAEYPHTKSKRFERYGNLTLKNVEICPAAFNIVEDMKQRVPLKFKGTKRDY
jgi:Fe-S-cluster containining protein